MKLVEIACSNLDSVINANKAGASRIELFENLIEGGCTPSYGMIKKAKEVSKIPVFVLIRPRSGNFIYSGQEIDIMLEDIQICKKLNVDGIVIGALTSSLEVDKTVCKRLLSTWNQPNATFHRAFDVIQDVETAIGDIIDLGFNRVLTSGGRENALEGLDKILYLQDKFNNSITFMAGGGIKADNAHHFSALSEIHASCKLELNDNTLFGKQTISDEIEIRQLIKSFYTTTKILDSFSSIKN